MRKNSFETKFAFIALHQVFMIAAIISIYVNDYIILHNPHYSESGHWIVAIVCLLGAMISLFRFIKVEHAIVKKQKSKRFIDRMPLEVLLLISGFLLWILGKQMDKIEINQFSLPGLAITVATVIYLMDVVFVMTFASVYRRIIKKHIKTDSLLYNIIQILANYETGKGFRELSRKSQEQARIKEALEEMSEGHIEVTLDAQLFHGQEREMVIALNRIQEGLKEAVEARIRDEKMKADLITNVSHDIKTPLTSIVNYVELLRREELENEKAKNYIQIIEEKAQRLKHLTEDLVEVSKISSGNIQLDKQEIDFLELLYQTGGEFNERFEQRNLTIVTKLPSVPVMIEADGRQLYRAIENLYTNAAKYAQENTKVYVELSVEKKDVVFTIKNISKTHIEIPSRRYEDLTERFVRGELSRTTEGSGLGLSIAKNLTQLMGGKFTIRVEGELFIAQIIFPVVNSR